MGERSDEPGVIAEETPPARLSSPWSRLFVLAALVVAACALAFGVLEAEFGLSDVPGEAEFGVPSSEAAVRLYLQPVQIDPVNESLQVRISLVPDPSAAEPSTIADRNFLLRIRRGNQVEHVPIRANQALPELTYEFDLDGGNVRGYPLDRYVSVMRLAAVEQAPDGTEKPLPIHFTAWEGILGFDVKGYATETKVPGELQFQFSFRRDGAVLFFGIAMYAAMIVMALCALIIGVLTFVGFRRIEATLVGALGAVIFALPALRNALPGSPPIGIRADTLIFFWAELGAVIGLCLFVAAWARHGARP